MRVAVFQAVRQQYGFRCGYCGISETDAGTTLTVDHFHPRSRGGSNDFSNLVYCCHACNEHKGDYWNPGNAARILHPINDDLSVHFTEQDDFTLFALTDTGRFHIDRLHLNRPPLIVHRRTKQQADTDRRDRAAVAETLNRVEEVLTRLSIAIESIRSGGE
jgi:uncharacterized protein (TIGR02646 family)